MPNSGGLIIVVNFRRTNLASQCGGLFVVYNLIMTEKMVTPKEFEEGLQEFVDKELTDFYYTTDSLVTLLAGRKYPNDKGSMDSEYDLMIWGAWEYVNDGQVIETSFMQSKNEDVAKLRERLENFINSLHPTRVTSIYISDDGKTAEIGLDIGGKFVVYGHDDVFVSYSHKTFDGEGRFVSAKHLRPDEDTGELILIEA